MMSKAILICCFALCLHASSESIQWSMMKNSKQRPVSRSCRTGNPIDDCWRCDPDWEANRKTLADCAIGFGRNAIGGRGGDVYIVSSEDDDPRNPRQGMLRHAVIQNEPLWIIFSRDMSIRLKEELMMNSYKTIDGRGHNIEISHGPAIQVTKRETPPDDAEWKDWNWRSDGDLLLNGAFFTSSGNGSSESYVKASSMVARPASLLTGIMPSAGVLNCKTHQPCI